MRKPSLPRRPKHRQSPRSSKARRLNPKASLPTSGKAWQYLLAIR